MADVRKTYGLILGIVLGVVGLWGFLTNSILGIFGVNTLQSVLHLIAAVTGIYAGTKGDGLSYAMVIGWIGVLLGILGFVPATAGLLMQYFNINMAITWLHLVIGIVSLGVHYGAGKSA